VTTRQRSEQRARDRGSRSDRSRANERGRDRGRALCPSVPDTNSWTQKATSHTWARHHVWLVAAGVVGAHSAYVVTPLLFVGRRLELFGAFRFPSKTPNSHVRQVSQPPESADVRYISRRIPEKGRQRPNGFFPRVPREPGHERRWASARVARCAFRRLEHEQNPTRATRGTCRCS